nr:RNA polymerase factor sigma-54 [uncultured Ligilactobacillus sp.]
MTLSQNINQKQLQKLAMTQQMQQSIKILKSTNDELYSYLKQKALENPFIDIEFHSNLNSKDYDINQFIQSKHQVSLDDYLLEQVHLTMRNTPIRTLVIYFIENLDDNGYLSIDIDKLYKEQKFNKTLVLDALTLLQRLDPPGIGARDLQECLILQTQDNPSAPQLALPILQNDFIDFTEKKWNKLAKKYKTDCAHIKKVLKYVRTLSPAPGAGYQNNEAEFIYPDLIVKQDKNTLSVQFTTSNTPKILFKKAYFNSFSKNTNNDVQKYLKEKEIEYEQLTAELSQREATILKVGQAIVKKQSSFFLEDSHPLKPLLLRDIAHQLQLHESTISRAISGKYLKCDFGIFELKSFFTTAASYAENCSISVNTVQQNIKKLISDEDKNNPLSDQKIVELLQTKKIQISRRTVAKYRSIMNIPSSKERKSL